MKLDKQMTALTLVALFTGVAHAQSSMSGSSDPSKSLQVPIKAENASGETGTAMLTPEGNQTRVVLNITGIPQGQSQPAHIHEGTCANLDPKPKYGLQTVTNGMSTTLVPVSLDTLLAGKLAINVHRSANDIATYVACGDIKR